MNDSDAAVPHLAVNILVVCTGNICRSPMTEALLAGRLAERGIAARVASAGLLFDDRPASDGAIAAMAHRGLDLGDHRSRTLTKTLVASCDLIIAMEPRHVREVVALHDDVWPVTFTLRELTARAATVGPRPRGEGLRSWLERLGAGRRRVDLLADDPALAVFDPYRQNQAVYDATAADLASEVAVLVDHAWSQGCAESGDVAPESTARSGWTQVRQAG